MDWNLIESWPLSGLSRRVRGPVHRWHVQETGTGPTMLLLHGAGGSTHSYRALIPLLAESHHVVALDLPGHGFTQLGARHRSGLDGMAEDVMALCAQEGWRPATIVGHSAGGAVALRMAQMIAAQGAKPPRVVGINAALGTFKGVAGVLFPAMAKLLAVLPFTASLFSGASANPERIKALIDSTGSRIDAEGMELYRRLVADRDHVDGALLMMAQWSLTRLLETLPTIEAQTLFIVADADQTVTPDVSEAAVRRMPAATVERIADLGHMVHEEDPERIAKLVLAFAAKADA